jgi:hypothetical protein
MNKVKIGKANYEVQTVEAFWNKVIVAQIDYNNKTITLAKRGGVSHQPRTKQQIEHAFWHEAVHGILKDMQSPLERNERFVDGLAARLMKLIKQVHPNESNVVLQRFKRIRKLPSQVLRSKRAKETQVSRNRANALRQRTTQSSRKIREGRPSLRAV